MSVSCRKVVSIEAGGEGRDPVKLVMLKRSNRHTKEEVNEKSLLRVKVVSKKEERSPRRLLTGGCRRKKM